MRYGTKRVALVLAVVLAALVLPISTVQSSPRPLRKLPFVEYATVTAVFHYPEMPHDPPVIYVTVSGSGWATYLGKISVDQYHTVYPLSMTFDDGIYTDTAANGATIFGRYHGSLVPLQNGDFEIHGIFTIDGGTGRLGNVVGGGGMAIGVQHLDNTGWLLLLGTISFE